MDTTPKPKLRVVEDDQVHTPDVLPAGAASEPDVRPPVAQGAIRTAQVNALGQPSANDAPTEGALLPFTAQVAAFGGAAAAGSLGGFLAARSAKGAAIGAGVNVTLIGLWGALMGEGRLSTTSRIVYAALGVAAGAGATWLAFRR
jgi:hypothetical protein